MKKTRKFIERKIKDCQRTIKYLEEEIGELMEMLNEFSNYSSM